MILTRYTLLKLLKNKWNQSITENLQLLVKLRFQFRVD